MASDRFAELWAGRGELTLLKSPSQPGPEPPCEAATEFQAFCDELLAFVEGKRGGKDYELAINQAYVQLQHRYMDYRGRLPPRHRNGHGKRQHPCIEAVRDGTYATLRKAEFALVGLPLAAAERSRRQTKPASEPSVAELILGSGPGRS